MGTIFAANLDMAGANWISARHRRRLKFTDGPADRRRHDQPRSDCDPADPERIHVAYRNRMAQRAGDAGSGECVPQVILVDVQMQGLSGVKLIEELRTRSKAGIYAISGSDPTDDMTEAADGFLLKPFGSETLQKLLNNTP